MLSLQLSNLIILLSSLMFSGDFRNAVVTQVYHTVFSSMYDSYYPAAIFVIFLDAGISVQKQIRRTT